MSDRSEFDLLVDLARLLKKYGPETFDRLAQELASPDAARRLAKVLTLTAHAAPDLPAREKGANARAASPRDFRLRLLELTKAEQEKADLLLPLYEGLLARTLLPNLRDIREFAAGKRLPPVTGASRPRAVIDFLESLASLPLDQLKSLVANLQPGPETGDRSLDAWTRIILEKERRTPRTGT